MPRPEKIIAGSAGALFVLAAALEGISRLGGKPAFHDAAAWVVMAAAFAVFTPVAVAAVVVACQTLLTRKKHGDSGPSRTQRQG
jgi:uncharacterized membrane protein